MKKIPLYRLLQENPGAKKQRMDKESIEWLYRNIDPKKTGIEEFQEKIIPISEEKLLEYLPKNNFFKKNPHDTIHGFLHISRVVIYTYLLTQINNIKDCRKYLLAACVHDLRRTIDSREDIHGEEAAKWFKKNHKVFGSIAKEDVEDICYAIKMHNRYEIIKIKDGDKEQLLKYLKSADALDRYRLPKKDWLPNKKYIPLKIDKKIFEFAKYFTLETERETLKKEKSAVKILIEKGRELGLIK